MKLVPVLALSLLAGCASPYRIQPVPLVAKGEPLTICYVHHAHHTRIVDARLVGINGEWAVMGDVRASRSKPPHRRRVRVEVVDASESLVLATISPTTLANLDKWSFHLPIPSPVSFDHMHLAVVSAEEAFLDLPPHARTDSYSFHY